MLMNQLKDTFIIIGTTLLAFFHPITDFLIAILILLFVNFCSGLLEDELHGEGWRGKKAWKAFTELFVLTGIGFFVFAIGHFMHNEQGAVQCVSAVCYAAIYYYSKNILKNWLKITPKGTTLNKVLGLLYYLISFYFFEKIPGIRDYFKKGETVEDDTLKGDEQNDAAPMDPPTEH